MNLDKPLLILVTSASQMGQGQQTGLWLEEFAVPYKVFKDNNIPVRVASPTGGKVPIDPRSVPDDEQKEAWKDPIDCLRYAAITGLHHMDESVLRATSGGLPSYGAPDRQKKVNWELEW